MIDSASCKAHQASSGATKKGSSIDWSLLRRPEHQDPRRLRRLGQPAALQADPRQPFRRRGAAGHGRGRAEGPSDPGPSRDRVAGGRSSPRQAGRGPQGGSREPIRHSRAGKVEPDPRRRQRGLQHPAKGLPRLSKACRAVVLVRDHVHRPQWPAENQASTHFERAAGVCQEGGGLAAMRRGSRELGRGECGFVIEKTFRTRPILASCPRLHCQRVLYAL